MLESYRSGQPSHSLGVLLSAEVLRYYAVLRLPVPPDGEGLAVIALPYFRDHRPGRVSLGQLPYCLSVQSLTTLRGP